MRLVALLLGGVLACGEGQAAAIDSAHADSIARVRQDSINRAQPGYVIDSILPVEEQLRRFRAGLDTVTQFTGGASSLDALITRFITSLEHADTASLIRLTVSRAEFAWLVFPDSRLSAKPYRQAPDVAWLRHASSSASGLSRLLTRIGGRPVALNHWHCGDQPDAEGRNRLWGDCTITFKMDGSATTLRLFSSVIERGGQFKILSYANAF